MAWNRRSRSSSWRGPAAMKEELEPSGSSSTALQPWACSSLSSSEKFLSLYDKMVEDREKKNSESLVCSRFLLQQAPPQPQERQQQQQEFSVLSTPSLIERPGSKIVFPLITSKGSVIGKKVYCRTSTHTNSTWRQKDSTQRMHTSLMILKFYQDRSIPSSSSSAGRRLVDENETAQNSPSSGDSAISQQGDNFPEKDQCRRLFLSLAGAAGMRLICPPVQLPLLEIILFIRQQMSSKNRAVFCTKGGGGGGGGLWRFPLNLALATLRPFSGSFLGRCLTTLLCLAQMTIKRNITAEQTGRYMPVTDLYSVVFEKENFDAGSTNRIRIDAPVVTETIEADQGVYIAERAKRNEIGTLLSNVVAGRKVDAECWNNEGIPVVEILISESENGSCLVDSSNVRKFLFLDQSHFGSVVKGCELSLVNLVLEDKLLKHNDSEVLMTVLKQLRTCENALAESRQRFYFSVRAAREDDTLAHSEFVGSPAQQHRSESPGSNAAKDADWVTTVSSIYDSKGVAVDVWRPLTDEMCIAEEEKPGSTSSVAQTTIDEPVGKQFVPRGGACFGVAELEPSEISSQSEALENKFVSSEFPDLRKSARFVRGESAADGFFELALQVCPIEERRTGDNTGSGASVSDFVSPESLQEDAGVALSEGSSAENIVEEELVEDKSQAFALAEAVSKTQEVLPSERSFLQEQPADKVPIEQRESLQEQTEVFVIERTSSEGELKTAGSTELSPDLTEAVVECHVVEETQGGNLEYWLEEDSEHIILDCSIEELIENVQQQIESFLAERTNDDEYLETTPPVETQSLGSTVVVEIQEVKAMHTVKAKCAESALDETPEVSPIEEHKTDDGNFVWSEMSRRHIAEVFQSERLSAEKESGDKDSLTAGALIITEEIILLGVVERVENEAVEITAELKSTDLIEEVNEKLCELELEFRPIEGHRIVVTDNLSLEREQSFTDVSLKADTELEKGSPAVAAVTLAPPEFQYLSTENQTVDEIVEVDPENSVEEDSAEEVLDVVLEVCPIEDCGSDESNWLLSERLHGQGVEVFLPETGSAGNVIEKESSASPRGHFEAGFDEGTSVSDQEGSNCSISSISSQENSSTGKEQYPPSSPTSMRTVADDDSQSEESFALYPSRTVSKQSCHENPDSEIIICNGDSLMESPTQTASTSRLNTGSETEKNALGADSGAKSFVADELNCDQTNEVRSEPKAKIVDVVTSSDSISAHGDSMLAPGPTYTKIVDAASITTIVSGSVDENCNLDRQLSAFADEIGVSGVEDYSPGICAISPLAVSSSNIAYCGVPESYPEHPFADHPTCIDLRERRHSHGDQTYIDMEELLPPPWGQLIFWHGRCKEGRPTLCVLLGKAVRQLDSQELKHFIAVTVSHLEYAELNFFKGNVKQMNILMDLDGLGFMRLPPMHILSSIGAVLNRDYAGRGGWIILVNAPVMLGFVISAIQGVILRPAQNKGAVVDSEFRGFLEGKECILMAGSKYSQLVLRKFDSGMLPVALRGDCLCGSTERPCKFGIDFLKLPWNRSSHI